MGYLSKETDTFSDLKTANHHPTDEFLARGLRFNMEPSFLGICTNYKTRMTYWHNSVSSPGAILLSTLVGHLVDQAKQGILFSESSWLRFRKLLLQQPLSFPEPDYALDRQSPSAPDHVLDYLKFSVAAPTVRSALADFYASVESAVHWDQDVGDFYNEFDRRADADRRFKGLRDVLREGLAPLCDEYRVVVDLTLHGGATEPGFFRARVEELYARYVALKPPPDMDVAMQAYLGGEMGGQSNWGC